MVDLEKYHELDKRVSRIEVSIEAYANMITRCLNKSDEIEAVIADINKRLSNTEYHVNFEDEDRPRRVERVNNVINELNLLKQAHDACNQRQKENENWSRNRKGSLWDNSIMAIIGVLISGLTFLLSYFLNKAGLLK